jgi:hypothetical protein
MLTASVLEGGIHYRELILAMLRFPFEAEILWVEMWVAASPKYCHIGAYRVTYT